MHSPSSSFRSESRSEMENDEVSIRLQNAKKEREKQIQDDKNKRGRTLVTKRAQTSVLANTTFFYLNKSRIR